MQSFLTRWFRRLRGPGEAPPAAPADPLAEADSAAATALPAAIEGLGAAGLRRPLISPSGALVGFEFRLPEALVRRSRRRTDGVGAAAQVAGLLASAQRVAHSGRLALARVPAAWWPHAQSLQGHPNLLIGLDEVDESDHLPPPPRPDLAGLRQQGARVGWPPASAGAEAGDFVLLRQQQRPLSELLAQPQDWAAPLRDSPRVLTDLADVDDLEAALGSGARLVCGALAPKPGRAPAPDALAPVPPEVRRIGRLLQQLAAGAETAPIADAIKADVGLSLRLLQRLGTASLAHVRAGASIEQAVLMLGRNELYRWLSVLLLQYAGTRRAASALQEVALWRARFMELLALCGGHDAPGELFSLGLASMLGLLLDLGPDEVAQTLNLPATGREALLAHSGPWAIYLRLPELIEQQSLDSMADELTRFGGAAQVQALSDEAWAWVAEHSAAPTAETWGQAA